MKRYKVVGTAPILDRKPGETFTDSIPIDLERFLIGIGGLAILQQKDEKPKAFKSADRR